MRSSPKDWFHWGLFVVSCLHAIQRLFCVCLNYEFKNLVLGRFATGSILCWLLVYKVLPDRYWSKHFWPSVNVDKNMFSLFPWSWGDTSLFPFSKIEARKSEIFNFQIHFHFEILNNFYWKSFIYLIDCFCTISNKTVPKMNFQSKFFHNTKSCITSVGHFFFEKYIDGYSRKVDISGHWVCQT